MPRNGPDVKKFHANIIALHKVAVTLFTRTLVKKKCRKQKINSIQEIWVTDIAIYFKLNSSSLILFIRKMRFQEYRKWPV